MPTLDETFDVNNPQHQEQAVARLTKFGLSGSASDCRAGSRWYQQAHEDVNAGRGEVPMRTAAGLASALSGGSDWTGRNVDSVSAIQKLTPEDWSLVRSTHVPGGKRHAEVDAMLRERAPILRASSNVQLLKGHSLLTGTDPEDAFSRTTSPKTHAFFHGVNNPRNELGILPMDYRAADVAANQMRPSQSYRGIGRGSYKQQPGLTPYEHYENIHIAAGQAMADIGGRAFAPMRHPLAAQGYIWHLGKQFELSHPEAPKGRGPNRMGQPYTSFSGSPLSFSGAA